MRQQDTQGRTRHDAVDLEKRERIVAHLRQQAEKREFTSMRKIAERLDLSHTYIIRVLNGKQTPGLDLVLRLHEIWKVSADHMIDDDPPRQYFEIGFRGKKEE